MNTAQLTDTKQINQSIKAGNARLTLVSKKTGTRFTYRVKAPKDEEKPNLWFVQVLTGPENETDYAYIGYIKAGKSFQHGGAKAKVGQGAPSVRAFAWFMDQLHASILPDTLEVWHEGGCGRCGRALTVPESIERGIGPECQKYMCV